MLTWRSLHQWCATKNRYYCLPWSCLLCLRYIVFRRCPQCHGISASFIWVHVSQAQSQSGQYYSVLQRKMKRPQQRVIEDNWMKWRMDILIMHKSIVPRMKLPIASVDSHFSLYFLALLWFFLYMTDHLLPEALNKGKGITARSADTDKHSFVFLYYQEQKLFPAPRSSLFSSSSPLSYKKSKPVVLILHGTE